MGPDTRLTFTEVRCFVNQWPFVGATLNYSRLGALCPHPHPSILLRPRSEIESSIDFNAARSDDRETILDPIFSPTLVHRLEIGFSEETTGRENFQSGVTINALINATRWACCRHERLLSSMYVVVTRADAHSSVNNDSVATCRVQKYRCL